MAPTRPLVNQQCTACTGVMGIPLSHTVILEGTIHADKRENYYRDHRIIFCTPQTLLNDMRGGKVDVASIVCVVIDEAHRATSNYAYTQIIQEIDIVTKLYRVLALSATPGSDMRKIQTVRTSGFLALHTSCLIDSFAPYLGDHKPAYRTY
jgi:Fanconi anemia group M protein